MARTKIPIDWESQITETPKRVISNDGAYNGLISEKKQMVFNGEKEYQAELITYLSDVFEKANIADIETVQTNHDLSVGGKRVKYDIYIIHQDKTVTIVECKYDKDKSPGKRLINQVKGIGQLMLYGEMHEMLTGVKSRLFLSDEKPEEFTLILLNKYDLGFIGLKNRRLFLLNPYNSQKTVE